MERDETRPLTLSTAADHSMTAEEMLRAAFVSVEVNEVFTHATVSMIDNSKLLFCHGVGERWVKATAAGQAGIAPALASDLLPRIAMFRLDRKHLDVQFNDGSRFEVRFKR
jgi:hypothetical protein